MKFIIYISDFIVPITVFYIIGYGILKKCNVFDSFVEGAKEGMRVVVDILPTLVGLMVAVGVVRLSGLLNTVTQILTPLAQICNFPAQLIPLSIVKMLSSSAATGLLLDLYKEYGADSFIGKAASIMVSCTETIFYTMSVYFGVAKVSKTRWTLPGALICTMAGTIAAVILAGYI